MNTNRKIKLEGKKTLLIINTWKFCASVNNCFCKVHEVLIIYMKTEKKGKTNKPG